MTTYFISGIVAALFLLVAALIAQIIKYEGGANPTDPMRRRIWFWIIGVINPAVFYFLAAFVIAPSNKKALEQWNDALPIATIAGFGIYLILGFILSKVFKNGKLGNWF